MPSQRLYPFWSTEKKSSRIRSLPKNFLKFCPLVTSWSFAPSGQRGAIQRRAPSRCTVSPTSSPARLPLASPFRRPLGRRCDRRRYRMSLGQALRRLGGSPQERAVAAPRELHPAGRTEQGARGSTHGTLQHHGPGRAIAAPARPAASPQGVMPPHHCRLLPKCPPGCAQTRLSRDLRLASSRLPCSPGNVLPGCCRYPGKQRLRPFDNPPLLPPPERHSSTPSARSSWGQPLSDCTIFFAAHLGVEMPAHSAARRERPASAFHDHPRSGGRRVNGARVEAGDSQLPRPCLLL